MTRANTKRISAQTRNADSRQKKWARKRLSLPADLAVRGSVEFIKALRNAGIRCFLASGTDEKDVIYEASLIGVKNLFDGGIHGAKDALLDCSKEAVIKT